MACPPLAQLRPGRPESSPSGLSRPNLTRTLPPPRQAVLEPLSDLAVFTTEVYARALSRLLHLLRLGANSVRARVRVHAAARAPKPRALSCALFPAVSAQRGWAALMAAAPPQPRRPPLPRLLAPNPNLSHPLAHQQHLLSDHLTTPPSARLAIPSAPPTPARPAGPSPRSRGWRRPGTRWRSRKPSAGRSAPLRTSGCALGSTTGASTTGPAPADQQQDSPCRAFG
jgi:hypothetical protein